MDSFSRLFKKLNYKSKLVVCYFLAISIPYAIGVIYIYSSIVSSAQANIVRTISQRMDQEQASIQQKMTTLQTFAHNFSINTELNDYFTPTFYSDLELIETTNNTIMPLISWMEASSEDSGSFRFLTDNTAIPESEFFIQSHDFQQTEWFKTMRHAVEKNGYYFEPLHTSRDMTYGKSSAKDVFSLFYSLPHAPETYFEMDITADYLFDTMLQTPLIQTGSLGYQSENQQIIGLDSQAAALADSTLTDEPEEAGRYITLGSDNYHMETRGIPGIGGQIISLVPRSEISQTTRTATYAFLVIFVMLSCLILLFAYLIASFLLIRINRMHEGVLRIQDGEYNTLIPVSGKDEIDELATGINTMSLRINELITTVYKAEVHQKEAELIALQSQINPHFLFNILETLRMMAELGETDLVASSIEALGNLMRYNLSDFKKNVPLEQELAIIEDYITIQNLLHNQLIHLNLEIPVAFRSKTIPSLLLQPIVENSIHHGLKPQRAPLTITIKVTYEESGGLLFSIKDNGSGIAQNQVEQLLKTIQDTTQPDRKSIGLWNVNQRLQLTFGSTSKLSIESDRNRGFQVFFKIPQI